MKLLHYQAIYLKPHRLRTVIQYEKFTVICMLETLQPHTNPHKIGKRIDRVLCHALRPSFIMSYSQRAENHAIHIFDTLLFSASLSTALVFIALQATAFMQHAGLFCANAKVPRTSCSSCWILLWVTILTKSPWSSQWKKVEDIL